MLIRGAFIMTGYRNSPSKTSETIDDDGWLHTGDIGEFDDEGYLKIVDRKKELIINAAGKNMSPANIEAKLKASSPRSARRSRSATGSPTTSRCSRSTPTWRPPSSSSTGATTLLERGGGASRDGGGVTRPRLARVEQIKRFTAPGRRWQPAATS